MSERINDFVLKIATVNGTGSASANGLLMKALFRMGVPVTGKNLFPSNIQGLPTWYEARVSHKGYMSRSGRVDVMVAMNAQTYKKDLNEVTKKYGDLRRTRIAPDAKEEFSEADLVPDEAVLISITHTEHTAAASAIGTGD